MGRQLPPRPRQGADAEAARGAAEVLPLPRRRRRRHPARARCRAWAPRAPTSCVARVTTSTAATPRIPTSTRKCVDRLTRKFGHARAAGAAAGHRAAGGADVGRAGHGRRLRRRGARGRRHARAPRHHRRLHAHPRFPVRRRRCERSSPSHETDLRHRAESRRAAALAAHDRDGRPELTASLASCDYGGLPITAREIVLDVPAELGDAAAPGRGQRLRIHG